jgi:RsiW-degrading membrane proteinase PrsW (M82 family)
MMCGFGFALAEIVRYSVGYWGANAYFSALATAGAIDNPTSFAGLLPRLADLSGSALLAQVARFITAPLLHACWAAVVGWFIAAASCRTGSRWPVVVMGLLLVAVLHGLYDVFSGGFVGIGLAAVSIVVFMAYLLHAMDEDTTTASD